VVLFADAVLLIFVYEAVWRLITRNLFLRIYLTIALILAFDSLAFTTSVFYGQPNYATILTSGIIGKLIMAAFYAFILTIYLRFAERSNHKIQPFKDVFHLLSYRQKFEIEQERGHQTASLLRESEGRYQTLATISPVGIFRTDANGVTTYVNPKWCEMSGLPYGDALGDGWLNAVHPDDREKLSEGWQEAARLHVESVSEYRFVRPDGATAWVMGQAVPEMNSEQQVVGYIGTITDITERKQTEEKVQRQLQRLEALRRIDMAITAGLDMNVSLGLLLEQLLAILKVDAAVILLLEPPTRLLHYAASRGFRTDAIQQTQISLGSGHAGRVALEGRVVHIRDLTNNPGDPTRSAILTSEKFKSYFAIPLIAKGQVKGVLEVFRRSSLSPDQEWVNFIETLANQAAITIDSAQLFEGMQKSNMELLTAYDATIAGWSHAMDLRDKETEGHTQRVTEITMQLARKMNIDPQMLVHIRRGALLHDIGKLGVPDQILLKPGKLTEEEWEIMRHHPVYALNMLMPITHLQPALDIPYCHHEKWDGTGYPRRLKGEQIPLAARLFAVVDVWDALGSDRPYRKAWPREQILQYIRDESGRQFDPQVVDAFLRFII
jgi:PAS domain S-box-containing protein